MFQQLLRLGIRQKIVLILLTTLLVGLTASTVVSLRSQAESILNETNRRGMELSHFVAKTLAYSVVAYDYHTIELLLQDLGEHEDVVYVRVTSPRGNVMGELKGKDPQDPDVRMFSKPINLNNEVVGELKLGLSTQRITATIEQEERNSLTRQLLVVFAVLLVEFAALSYIIIRPLNIMSDAMHTEAVSDGQAPQIEISGRDEFGEIATQFNRLHARLNEARAKLQARAEHADQALARAYEQLAGQAEDLKRKNMDLEMLAITDPLTGLYNKRYFENLMGTEVDRAVNQNQICSILLVDIDDFKNLNERYGHKLGDSVLREVARRLSLRTRKSDVLCRFGGDEFFLLCRNATMANAMNVAEQMHESISREPMLIEGQTVPVALSIGIATIPGPKTVTSASEFFECADAALLRSKQLGPNTSVHFSRMPSVSTPRPHEDNA